MEHPKNQPTTHPTIEPTSSDWTPFISGSASAAHCDIIDVLDIHIQVARNGELEIVRLGLDRSSVRRGTCQHGLDIGDHPARRRKLRTYRGIDVRKHGTRERKLGGQSGVHVAHHALSYEYPGVRLLCRRQDIGEVTYQSSPHRRGDVGDV